MRDPQKRERPAGTGRGRNTKFSSVNRNKKSARLPDNWRGSLPDPLSYFGQHVKKLTAPNAAGWSQGACPFHNDRTASLSVGVEGGWRCFASCGSGDMVGFHQRLTGLPFIDAVRDLIGSAK